MLDNYGLYVHYTLMNLLKETHRLLKKSNETQDVISVISAKCNVSKRWLGHLVRLDERGYDVRMVQRVY